MKKLFCILALFVFLPCSVPAANDTDTVKPFQIVKSYKFGHFERQDFYAADRLLNNNPDRENEYSGSSIDKVRTCPSGKYRKNGGSCVPYCQGLTCTKGTQPTPMPYGCCCH
ncbi:MAG: hypothetical protein IKR09_04745 [Alphaproteobacteria bacterium]|nr:hypothetical protein [Alphaproteobacteria bacterium]